MTGLEFIIFSNTPSKKNQQIELDFLTDTINSNEQETPALSDTLVQALMSVGISDKNIAKYLSKGFMIIDDEKKRKAAIKRCPTLGDYYLEKLELTKKSAPEENAAGFLISALKQDWGTTKTVQQHKNREAILRRKEAETTLKKFGRQIESLIKKRKSLIQPIIKNLIKDDRILETAYKAAMEGLGDFVRSHISSVKHLPIRQQYEQQTTIEQLTNAELAKMHPDKFISVREINDRISQAENNIETLKKQHRGL